MPLMPVMDVERPVAALAELAVADDIDAGLDLLAHDLLDRGLQAGLVGGLVVGLAGLDQLEELDELGRPDQAADMGGQDAVGAAAMRYPPAVCCDCAILAASCSRAGWLRGNAWQIRAKALNRRP